MTTAIANAAGLLQARCCHATDALDAAEAARLLAMLPGWQLEGAKLSRSFSFSDYYHTMAFVNAIAFLSHTEDHHPELTVTYKTCVVRYDTHSVNQGRGGLSGNDFICAAKASALYDGAAVPA